MGGIDFTQIMELVQLFNSQTNLGVEEKAEEIKDEGEPEKYPPIIFDEQLQTQNMKMIKSIIPYMDLNHQKLFGVIIKCMEIQKLMERKEDVSAASLNPKHQREDMLKALKPYCSKQNQQNIDMLMKLFEMKEILKQVEELKEFMG